MQVATVYAHESVSKCVWRAVKRLAHGQPLRWDAARSI